jgi:microcystin-dependent protein
LSIAQNTALFSILGTTYGGDGVRTFALPDLRGRAPVHYGQGPGRSDISLGETYGNERITLTTPNLPPAGAVQIAASSAPATTNNPTNNYLASGDEEIFTDGSPNATMAGTTSVNPGGGQPIAVGGPRLALNYIICLYGIYPSRS